MTTAAEIYNRLTGTQKFWLCMLNDGYYIEQSRVTLYWLNRPEKSELRKLRGMNQYNFKRLAYRTVEALKRAGALKEVQLSEVDSHAAKMREKYNFSVGTFYTLADEFKEVAKI